MLFLHIIARRCPTDPPDYFMQMEQDWPMKSRDLGTQVTYSCPIFKATWEEKLTSKSS